MPDILIVHASEDLAVASRLAADLRTSGFDAGLFGADRGAPSPPGASPAAPRTLVIWSNFAIASEAVLDAVANAVASGTFHATRLPTFDPRLIPAAFRGFPASPAADIERVKQILQAAGARRAAHVPTSLQTMPAATVSRQVAVLHAGRETELGRRRAERQRSAKDDPILETRAWTYANQKGNADLIRKYLDVFPRGRFAAKAQQRLADLEGSPESPEANARTPWFAFAVTAAVLMLFGLFVLSRLAVRPIVDIPIAMGGSEGAYQPFVDRYNDHLRPFGVRLVPHPEAKSSFDNVRLLADGQVNAAFVKGGMAGALRDPDYMTPERIQNRGKDWDLNWNQKLDHFTSLGRVALEPLWVFTFGASESDLLNELDGEPINIGNRTSGTRTLATLLLERNKVRNKPGLWLDTALPIAKPDDPRPLGEARALFLQQPAESPRIRALLENLAPEKTFDKSRIIRAATFSPAGRRLGIALGDNTARIWSSADGSEIVALKGHTDVVNDIAFSPDGKRVVTGGDDETVRIWDAATGAQLALLTGSGKDINGVSFSADGTRIASASESSRATIRDANTGAVMVRLEGHSDDLNSAVFSHDGRRVVTASRDDTARIWDAASGQQQLILTGHTKAVASATFSHDGRFVATASWDGTARIWDAQTGRTRIILIGHEDIVRSVEFSPDDKLVITGSWDDSARVWEVSTGRQVARINGLRSNVNGVGFSPDGTQAFTASQDGSLRLWNTKTWEKMADYHAGDQTTEHKHARKLHLMDFEKEVDAYISRFPFLSKVQLPRGGVSFEPHVPAKPVTLLATTVALVVDKTWAENHKSLVRVLTDAIVHKPQPGLDESTRKPRLFHRGGQFPNLNDPEFEVSPLAVPVYRTGDVPFLLGRLARVSPYVPFTTAAWLDEHAGTVVLSLIPLLGILIPLMRALPALYNWTVRRRILYWYQRLTILERRLEREGATASFGLSEIDRIDAAVSRIKVPLNYSDQYYDLRQHIDLVRQRLLNRGAAKTETTAAREPVKAPV